MAPSRLEDAGGGFVREDLEDLVEPRDFKNAADAFTQSEERESPAIGTDALHGLDQHGKAGTVDIADRRKIDQNAGHFFFDERFKGLFYLRRTMEIDFSFEGQNASLWRGSSGHLR